MDLPRNLISRLWILHKPSETWMSASLGIVTGQAIIEYSPNTVNETRAAVIYTIRKGEKGFTKANRELITTKNNPNCKIETEQIRCEQCLAFLMGNEKRGSRCNDCLDKGSN